MKGTFLLVSMVTLVVHQVNPANILVLSFFSTKSHKLTYQPLIEELGKRGHNVTMVTPVKASKVVKGVTEIFTMDVEKALQGDINIFKSKETGAPMGVNPFDMIKLILDTCQQSYELPQVKALLEQKFDLAFIQPFFNSCALGLLYRLQIPIVLFTSVTVPPAIGAKVGSYLPSSTTPNFLLGYPPEMTFTQRFINFGVETAISTLMYVIHESKAEAIYREKLGDDIPSVHEILANSSLVLSNGHFSLNGAKPYNPDVIDVGGIHSRPAKPVPKDLEDFINKGKEGFILFSMGSAIKGDMMPEAKRQMILNVFSRLNQQVLWKWESESMPNLPKNVKLSKWLPQQDLLGHKDIKMFITHCGGGSTEEAIYHGVPLVGLPMMADQTRNAALAKTNGLLIDLDWNKLTEAEFESAISEILHNPKYRDNAKKLSILFKDRPMDPLELGVYWIEYVLRHKGAHHLRSAARKLNLLQFYSVDVMAAYLAIILALLYVIYVALKFLVNKICTNFRKDSQLEKGKKRK